jgi:hypothetical protein
MRACPSTESAAAQDEIVFIGDAFDIDAPVASSNERAFLIAMGLTEEEADEELNASRQAQPGSVGEVQAPVDEAPAAGPGEGGGKGAQVGADAGANAGEAEGRPGLALQGQTPEEIAAEAERRIAGRAAYERVKAAVVVHRDHNTQRMYLHSVTTKESLQNPRGSRVDAGASERSGSTGAEGMSKILHDLLTLKGDVSKVVDENGEPLGEMGGSLFESPRRRGGLETRA